MPEIDPIVARILLAGDDEFLSSLKRVGEQASENFEKLAASIEKGAQSAEVLTGSLGLIEAAIGGAVAATVLFVEQQTELSQKTILLADAFGTTAGQLQDLEAVFASSGVKVEQFERFANRLTITIAREWPAIAESVKTYANENDAATLRVANSILHVQEAQNKLSDNSAARASQIAKDNTSLEQSYNSLRFAAQKAASEQLGAFQSLEGAQLSVTAAEQHLAELEGRPPSAAEKQSLQLSQAQLAVDQALRAEQDAQIALQEKAVASQLKVQQQQQAFDDLARKAAQNARDDALQRQKDENAVREAIIARGEAEEKANKFALTSVVSIRSALDGVVDGNKAAASAINLTEVSVQNLTRGIIAQAAEHSKATEPTGYETMIALSKTLSAATEGQISEEQKLAVVNRLAATGMQALGGVGAELLHVLEHDTAELQKFSEQAKALDTADAKKSIEDFRGALAGINLTISILSQRFAIAISPAFTAFLKDIQSSIESDNGLIHTFIAGIQGIAAILGDSIRGWIALKDAITSALNLQPGTAMQALLLILAGFVAAFASAWLAVPIAIALVVVAIGDLKKLWEDAKLSLTDNVVVRFWERLYDVIAKVKSLLTGGGWQNPAAGAAASAGQGVGNAAAAATGAEAGAVGNPDGVQLAGGGHVQGPGSATSDSIPAWLSAGEFVNNAASVQKYGVDFFHALNTMQIPGFAEGGLVPHPVRLAGGGNIPASSTLNLSIDGRSFNGLRGPKSTIDDLSSFAISRQASAAGTNPSWMK